MAAQTFARRVGRLQLCFLVLIGLQFSVNLLAQAPRSSAYRLAQEIDSPIKDFEVVRGGEYDLLCDYEGALFLLMTRQNRLIKFSPEGKVLAEIGGFGFGARQFNRPSAFATPDQGLSLYVLDTDNRRVVRLNNNLEWIGQIRIPDFAGDRKIGDIHALAVSSELDLYFYDQANWRILRLDRNGKYLGEIDPGTEAARIQTLAMDETNYLYVLLMDGEAIMVFDDLGNLAGKIDLSLPPGPRTFKVGKEILYISGLEAVRAQPRAQEACGMTEIRIPQTDSKRPVQIGAIAPAPSGGVWILDLNHNRIYGYDRIKE